jgi:hypothetical protein
MRARIALFAFAIVLMLPASSHAAFSGSNGRIAFEADRDANGKFEIYTVEPGGAGEIQLTHEPGTSFTGVGWSPDGRKVAFACNALPNHDIEVCIANPDGSGLTQPFAWYLDVDDMAWSPDGNAIAFAAEDTHCPFQECEIDWDIAKVNVDGTGFAKVTNIEYENEKEPAWSPDGAKLIWGDHYPNFSPDGSKIAYSRLSSGDEEVFVSNSDGTGEVRLTANAVNDSDPAFSPDGSKIAFTSDEGGDYEIFTMNADGTGRQAITSNSVTDRAPDWQPLPINGYPRPKGAMPLYASLTVAYDPCTTPNRTHGAPLSAGSCNPPSQASDFLTVGTLDSNGERAKSVGSVQLWVMPGDISTPADEADVPIGVAIKDVRKKSDLSDYAGELSVATVRRITDKDNAPSPGGTGAGTTADAALSFAVPCIATSDPSTGSLCSLTTSSDTLVAGSVKEGRRSIWELRGIEVYDGGADGVASTAPNTLFMTQGIFVP